MSDLLIPLASLPGFDPTGLRVWVAAGDREARGVVATTARSRGDRGSYASRSGRSGPICRWTAPDSPAREVAIDLADAATRDRVARWVAGWVGLAVGCTAPRWCYVGLGAWYLGPSSGASRWWTATRRPSDPASEDNGYGRLPCLADLDPTDPTLLTDGSRQVDAVALGRVAVQLGRSS